MKKSIACAFLLALGITRPGAAQGFDELNLQVHGYATQGFLYSTNNNIFTTTSSDGSAAWTEAVVNVSAQPAPKLRIAFQGRYFLLGNYGNAINLDWASIDYKVEERIGFRLGKVKTPIGLFNEIQDIDPAYLWALLPQSLYPITSRNSILTHYGGVVYGTLPLPAGLGKLEYRGFGGEGVYNDNDGYFVTQAEAGNNLPQGIRGGLYGGALHWKTPLHGLMVGASALKAADWTAPYTSATPALTGSQTLKANTQPNYFTIYEKGKLMVAVEYSRDWGNAITQFPGQPAAELRNDDRGQYAMVSYKLTSRLTVGVYDSQNSDRQAPFSSGRYQKDLALSSRYDFSQFLYAKAEQHFIQGTGLGYDTTLNPDLQPNTRLTVLKLGVSF